MDSIAKVQSFARFANAVGDEDPSGMGAVVRTKLLVLAWAYDTTYDEHLTRQLAREPGIFRLCHQSQRLCHTLIREQVQKRRLLQLCRQPLTQRTIEDRIAGCVGELGEDDAVLLAETSHCLMRAEVQPSPDCSSDNYHGGNQNFPELPATRDGNFGHFHCAR